MQTKYQIIRKLEEFSPVIVTYSIGEEGFGKAQVNALRSEGYRVVDISGNGNTFTYRIYRK